MSRVMNILGTWIPLAIVVTAFCALGYMTQQQAFRQGANDPQIQMAEDAAAALNQGADSQAVLPQTRVELSRSLAPFLMVFDATGKAVASSGRLNGTTPDYPLGALEAAKQGGENRVTWQPQAGTRIASVVVPYKQGYVVAGRSLREVEKRIAQTETIAAVVWLVTMLGMSAAVAVFSGVRGGDR